MLASLLIGSLILPGCKGESRGIPTVVPHDARNDFPNADASSRTTAAHQIHDDDWFETVTPSTGVDFAYRNGDGAERHTLLETLGGGAGLVDFDRDGDVDLFITGGGTIPKGDGTIGGLAPALFRNLGEFRFERVDVAAGLTECRYYSHGCAAADVNRDGFLDIAVAGYGGVLLYLNHGDGTFAEIAAEAGLAAGGWCTALAWNDVDRDGWNDLFVARYVTWTLETNVVCPTPHGEVESCDPTTYPPSTSFLFRNLANGTFADESVGRGITAKGNGLGVVAVDLGGDGRCAFYVANDETDNLLYLPSDDGTYREAAQLAGVATDEFGNDEGSMGIAVGDFDGDLRPDLFVTNFEREDNSLYRNLGDGMFLHVSQATGLSGPSRMYVGFGATLTDFDADGWPDLFLVNGHVFPASGLAGYRQPPQLFRNVDGRRFEDASSRGGEYFARRHAGRGVAAGDLDDDGAMDVVIVHQNDPVEILRNRRRPERFVRIVLRGTTSNAEAIGATVRLRDGERAAAQWMTSGAGYFSQQDSRLLFVVTAPVKSVDVQVTWPTGQAERYDSLEINRTHELVEGHGAKVP
jgi:hypothetical protein